MLNLNQATLNKIIDYVPGSAVIALGSGEGTVQIINALSEIKNSIDGIITSTKWTKQRVRELGLISLEPNDTNEIDLYIDTALEATTLCNINKGEDIELLRIKFLSKFANRFICCIDDTRLVEVLGSASIAVEVIPSARSYVSRKLTSKKMNVQWSANSISENGNHILLIKNYDVYEPMEFEKMIQSLPGVLACSIFSLDSPHKLLVSKEDEVVVYGNKLSRVVKNIFTKTTSPIH